MFKNFYYVIKNQNKMQI